VRRRTLPMTIAAVALTVGLAAPQIAQSAPNADPRAEREKVRAEKARVASQIDTSKASMAEIDAALRALQDDLNTQEAALAKAEADVAQAEKDIADAEAAIVRLTKEIAVLRKEMSRRAIDAFVRPEGDALLQALSDDDVNTASSRSFYVELRSQTDADVADRLLGADVDLDHEKAKATEARERAEAQREEQARRTETVREAKQRQDTVAANLQRSIDSQVARSLELAATDRKLSQQIAREQALLVARLAEAKAAKERANKAAAKEQERLRKLAAQAPVAPDGNERPPSSGGGGGGGGGGDVGVTPGGADSGVALAYVQGVPVNAQVAAQVAAMINAASADGVSLRIGNSYRSVSHQIQLRKSNCGTSYYAIYEMPSGSCRPPTAKPGQSQHQLGLAIDFASCSSRSTACYQWLAGNASRFGYYNLPSEPWHWSTTGS
jgi:hypothetical protein